MTIARLGNAIYTGLAADDKQGIITNPITDSLFFERDTGKIFRFNGTWGAILDVTADPNAITTTNTKTLSNKTLDSTTMSDGANIALGTTTGTKIGTLATHKLSFYGVTPVVQPVANPDTTAATLAALETEVNELKALLRSVGLMAP